jgi:TRAP-type C4-dicarboxylate transport system permease small subunit
MTAWRLIRDHGEEALAMVLLGVMLVDMAAQVISRYVFDDPLIFTEELARYLYVWLVFLGASAATRNSAHVGIAVLTDLFDRRLRAAVAIAMDLLVLAFLAAIVWWGALAVERVWDQDSVTLGVSLGTLYLAVPIGGALMILRLLGRIAAERGQPNAPRAVI